MQFVFFSDDNFFFFAFQKEILSQILFIYFALKPDSLEAYLTSSFWPIKAISRMNATEI